MKNDKRIQRIIIASALAVLCLAAVLLIVTRRTPQPSDKIRFTSLKPSEDGSGFSVLLLSDETNGKMKAGNVKAKLTRYLPVPSGDTGAPRYEKAKKGAAACRVTASGDGLLLTAKNADSRDGSVWKLEVTVKDGSQLLTSYALIRDDLFLLSPGTLREVVAEMTREEKARLVIGDYTNSPVPGNAGSTSSVERLGIPCLSLADGPQGVRIGESTVWYPSGAVTASTWDNELIRKIGESIGLDCVSSGVDVILGPGMNIQRICLGGRNFEYFSEDPFLTGKAASLYTEGVQSTGTGVSLKHYALNNQETARGTYSAVATERAIREIYLKAFSYAVREQDPYTVMSSYNRVNGTYTSVHAPLLGLLRSEFGFTGFVMSDWGSGGGAEVKVVSGNDLTEPGDEKQYETVLKALEKGIIDEEKVDTACERILRTVLRSNTYQLLFTDKARGDGQIDFESRRKIAEAAAESGMVLLKNEGALPVAPEKENGTQTRVALIGLGGFQTVFGGAGSGQVNSAGGVTIESGLFNAGYLLDSKLATLTGYSDKMPSGFEQAVNDASSVCDFAAFVISRKTSEGADNYPSQGGFLLTEAEKTMLTKTAEVFHKAGKKIVVVLNTGNPIETESWKDLADAILWCGLAGEETGNAVANLISGKANPSGKLTITWPVDLDSTPYASTFPGSSSSVQYNDDIYVGYRYYTSFGVPVSFPFGFGLSYTDFTYSDFRAEKEKNGNITLYITVKNTGSAAGREAVQFYVSKPEAEGLYHPVRELCGYSKTRLLKPGQKETLKVTVTHWELESFVTEEMNWKVLPGTFAFSVGASCENLLDTKEIALDANAYEIRHAEDALGADKNPKIIGPDWKPEKQSKGKAIAKNVKVYCSGIENSDYPPEKAVDGDPTTRWSDSNSKNRWIVLDLGKVYKLKSLDILWESNTGEDYRVEVSEDDPVLSPNAARLPELNFRTVEEAAANEWNDNEIDLSGTEARFIRIAKDNASGWFSIYEINVYAEES